MAFPATPQLNPTITDPFPSFQLYQLRRQVFDAMGFIYSKGISQLSTVELPIFFSPSAFAQMGPLPSTDGQSPIPNSPNSLVYEIKQRLGLPNPVAVYPDVLGNMITQLANFLGLGAMIKILPANVVPLLTNFINQAEQDLWRDIELDSGGNAIGATLTNPPTRMATAAATTTTGTFTIAAVGSTQVVPVTSAAGFTNGLFLNVTDGVSNITGKITTIAGLNITVTTTVLNTGAAGGTMATNALVIVGQMSTLDATAIMQRAIGLGKLHYGQDDGEIYLEQSKKYVSDYARRSPPNITSIIQLCLIDAQRKILRRIEMGGVYFNSGTLYSDTGPVTLANGAQITVSQFLEPSDATSIDKEPVFLLALAAVKSILNQKDAKESNEEFEDYMKDLEARLPHDAVTFVNNALKRAQETLYRQYRVFRMQRWYTWTQIAGVNFYSVYGDDNSLLLPPTGVTATVGTTVNSSMSAQRQSPLTALLSNGTVLVAGGVDSTGTSQVSADVYNPSLLTFSPTGFMNESRSLGASVCVLSSGKVLITGGSDGAGNQSLTGEIYDPSTGLFTQLVTTMNFARAYHTSTLLANGTVLIAGGYTTFNTGINKAEIFDPVALTFTTANGNMSASRFQHSATLLTSGKVLIAGGRSTTVNGQTSAELFDPVALTFTATGSMTVQRTLHTATLLTSGSVLIAGGGTNASTPVNTAEVYNPVTAIFVATAGAMSHTRMNHTAIRLTNGGVLIAGDGAGGTSADIFSLGAGTFTATGAMPYGAAWNTAVALSSTSILLAGGYNGSIAYATAMLYNVVSGTFTSNGSQIPTTAYYRVAAQTNTGSQLVGGITTTVSPGTTTPSVQAVGVGSITATVMTITAMQSGAYAVGDVVTGGPSPFTITSFGTATGQTGTYNGTPSQTAAPGTVLTANDAVVQSVPANTSVVISWTPLSSSNVTAYAIYGRTAGAEQLIATVPATQTSYTDNGLITPSGAMPTVNTTASNFGSLDPREVTEVYRSSNGTNWSPLAQGIPPFCYNATVTGPPQRYEIRQAIEVWPPPTDSTWQIQIKGYFSPLPFVNDTDINSIDPQAIYLKTLIDAQIHYKRGDPKATGDELERYISHLVSGTHLTARYVPGARGLMRDATRPIFVGYTNP